MEITSFEKIIDNFSDLIGVPTSLKSTLVASVQDNINFETIRDLVFGNNEGWLQIFIFYWKLGFFMGT